MTDSWGVGRNGCHKEEMRDDPKRLLAHSLARRIHGGYNRIITTDAGITLLGIGPVSIYILVGNYKQSQ